MDGFMDSPDHRHNILDLAHRKVSIGFAWGPRRASVWGDYVEFDRLPSIKNGVLSLSGRVEGGVWFRWERTSGWASSMTLRPESFIATSSCGPRTYGPRVAMLRWPLRGGQ